MSKPSLCLLTLCFLTAFLLLSTDGFLVATKYSHRHLFVVLASNNKGSSSSSSSLPPEQQKPEKKGYKFGDITKSLGKRITGDENYQLGDVSRRLDQRAKARVEQITGKTYVFGDLTRWTDSQIKEKVANYTGKDTYEVGDFSKEVVRRVWEGQYDLEDVVLLIRVLLQLGAEFTPIARLMPVKFLLEVLNVGLAQDVGGRVMKGVAKSLDERFKAAILGNPDYQIGDKSKERIAQALAKITGKDEYKVGDLTEVITKRMFEMESKDGDNKNSKHAKAAAEMGKALLDLSEDGALKEWDKKFMEGESKKRKA